MPLFKKALKDETVLVFDIGSASIGGALLHISKHSAPHILYTTRLPIVFQQELTLDRFHLEAFKTLGHVLQSLEKERIKQVPDVSISRIECFLSSTWITSLSKRLVHKSKETVTVSERLISQITSRGVKHALHSLKEEEGELEPTEKRVMSVSLNGYMTKEPYGKRAQHIEVFLYLSAFKQHLSKRITDVFEKVYPEITPRLHSTSLATFSVTQKLFPHESTFLITTVSGETTDIFLVHNNVVQTETTIGVGSNEVLRTLSRELQTVPEEALSVMRLSAEKEKGTVERLEKTAAITMAEEQWAAPFYQALKQLGLETVLPKTLFLLTSKDSASWFERILSRLEHGEHLPGRITFKTIPFSSQKLDTSFTKSPQVKNDTFLELETIFLEDM